MLLRSVLNVPAKSAGCVGTSRYIDRDVSVANDAFEAASQAALRGGS